MTRRVVSLAAMILFALGCLPQAVKAQTQYNSVALAGVPGEPRASFYFGHYPPDGNPGVTELVVQCDFNRAWLITDYYTQQQEVSRPFAISCQNTGGALGPYVVENTPLTVTIGMYGQWSGILVRTITLTVNSAQFTVAERYSPSKGSATITF